MKKCIFFVRIFLLVSSVMAEIDPTARMKIDSVEMIMDPNPYLNKDDWSFQLESGGQVITVHCPVKAEIPEDMAVKFEINMPGSSPMKHEVNICEGFDDPFLAKEILEHGQPTKTFPKACIIQPGNNYVLRSYKLPADKIPPGTPDGKFSTMVHLVLPGQKPILTMDIKGEMWHEYM